jgi:Protein of unknown function (DUF4242)
MEIHMKRYMIERDLPGVGALKDCELAAAAAKSNAALEELGGRAEWVQSFVTEDKTFCIYLAEDDAAIHEHARISGFPATRVTRISGIIDPSTAG